MSSIKCIPEDLIFEILARLPVKSNLKFRCVSKSWCSIISSKGFIDSQLNFSRKDTNFVNHYAVLSFVGWYHSDRKQYSLKSVLNKKESAIGLQFPMIDANEIDVVGYCNGLCCILAADGRDVFLWNPATRKCNLLPHFHGTADDEKATFPYCRKFGFGFADNAYKLLVSYIDPADDVLKQKLYSSRTNSWKIVVGSDFRGEGWDCGCRTGELVKGVLHWLDDKPAEGLRRLVCFDLVNEVPGILKLPNGGCDSRPTKICGDQEHLVLTWNHQTYVNIWISKSKMYWEKLATVPYDPLTLPFLRLWFVSITPKGEILMLAQSVPTSALVLYNLKNNSVTDSVNTNSFLCRRTSVYIQSLVSPNVAV